MFIVVTDSLDSAINRSLDTLREMLPENERSLFDAERHIHRDNIIAVYDESGKYPEIVGIEKRNEKND